MWPRSHGSGEWKLAGLGTISADGKTVVSDPGVGIPRFCGVCGLLSQSCPPNPNLPQPPPSCPAPSSPNPIDYYTGQEMPTSAGLTCQGLVPIDTGMTYNLVDAFNGRAGTFGSVGLGWTLDYDVVLLPFSGPQKRLVMPGGRFHDFVDDGSGTYRNSGSRMFDGAVMRAYPAGGPGDWEVVMKNGRTWRFKPFPGITGVIRGGPPLFMTEMVDPAGATLSITRRSDGRLLAAGTQQRAVTATLGANGFIAEIKDPENRTTRFTYSASNRIQTVTDPVGGVTRYTYADDSEIAPDAICGAQPTTNFCCVLGRALMRSMRRASTGAGPRLARALGRVAEQAFDVHRQRLSQRLQHRHRSAPLADVVKRHHLLRDSQRLGAADKSTSKAHARSETTLPPLRSTSR